MSQGDTLIFSARITRVSHQFDCPTPSSRQRSPSAFPPSPRLAPTAAAAATARLFLRRAPEPLDSVRLLEIRGWRDLRNITRRESGGNWSFASRTYTPRPAPPPELEPRKVLTSSRGLCVSFRVSTRLSYGKEASRVRGVGDWEGGKKETTSWRTSGAGRLSNKPWGNSAAA